MRYTIWNDNDPNDRFTIGAESPSDAAFRALEELGWCVGGAEDEEHDLDAPHLLPEDFAV
jgi:hypothetical protein